MSISKEDVYHVAKLARLKLNEDEAQKMTKQLSDILSHMDKLAEVDTNGVKPTFTVQDLHNIWRGDVADRSIDRKAILKNAPEKEVGMFKVPSTLEEGESSA